MNIMGISQRGAYELKGMIEGGQRTAEVMSMNILSVAILPGGEKQDVLLDGLKADAQQMSALYGRIAEKIDELRAEYEAAEEG